MKTIQLSKPAIEYTSEERLEIYIARFREILADVAAKNPDRLRSYQVGYAKGRATKAMLEAGF